VVHNPLRPGHVPGPRWRRTAAAHHVAHIAARDPEVEVSLLPHDGFRRRPKTSHHQLALGRHAMLSGRLAARSRLGFASGVGLDAGRRSAGLRISSGLARPAAGCVSHPPRGSDPELGMDAGGRSAGLRINSGLACADPGVGLDAGQRYAALTLADAAQACELTAACRVLQHGCGRHPRRGSDP